MLTVCLTLFCVLNITSHLRRGEGGQGTWQEATEQTMLSDPCLEPCLLPGWEGGPPERSCSFQPPSLGGQGGWSSWPGHGAQPIPRNVGLWAVCFGSVSASALPAFWWPPTLSPLQCPPSLPAAFPGSAPSSVSPRDEEVVTNLSSPVTRAGHLPEPPFLHLESGMKYHLL